MTDIDRTKLLLQDKHDILSASTVAIYGIGGVGGYCVEALARAGVGKLILVDGDTIAPSNLNRQIIALNSTIGMSKVQVARDRVADINPNCIVTVHNVFYDESTMQQIDMTSVNYCADCIDSVDSKILLITTCQQMDIPILSCMGTANRLHADFEIKDIFATTNCPLASKMRRMLRKAGVVSQPALVSKCLPDNNCINPLSSISYVPAVAGLLMAQHIILYLIGEQC
ncbi:MAG: ThiF family adenylyltransferase [Clostridia bacterium]|nr:ThiF family adenylyltransferase [Clostridia bacterium]